MVKQDRVYIVEVIHNSSESIEVFEAFPVKRKSLTAKNNALRFAKTMTKQYMEEDSMSVYCKVVVGNETLYIGTDGMEDTIAIDWLS
ncbi:hypothetical protein AAHH67_15670 [Niallia circulans]